MERRRFIVKAGGALAAAGAAAVVDAPNVIAQPKVQWRMSTTWTPALDVMQGTAERLAEARGRDERRAVPDRGLPGRADHGAFRVLRRRLQGHDRGASWATAYYWADKEPAFDWFAAIPFGMNAAGMAAWYHQGDGLKLWEETLRRLQPRAASGSSRPARRWPDGSGRRSTRSRDFKGLKMRILTSAARSTRRRVGRPFSTPGSEIYAALERGVIDASEWVGPHDDMKLGLHNTARYYYYPGWHEPGNHDRVRLQPEGVRGAAGRPQADARPCGRGDARLQRTPNTRRRTRSPSRSSRPRSRARSRFSRLPVPVLRELKKLAAEVVKEESEKSPMARKVHALLHEVPGAARRLVPHLGRRLPPVRGAVMRVTRSGSPHRGSPLSVKEAIAMERRQVHRQGRRRAGGRGSRGGRRRSERHRPAEGPVADVHDLDAGARRVAGRGGAARPVGGRDERRAVPDRSLSRAASSCRRLPASMPPRRAPSRRSWACRTTGPPRSRRSSGSRPSRSA